MTLLGDFAKAFVIMTFGFWIFLMIEFTVTGRMGLALLFIIGFIPPLFMIAYGYLRNGKKGKTDLE